MTDFLFHKVSEEEKQEIKKQAKAIMDNFANKLSKINKKIESFIEGKEGEREEKEGKCDENFSKDIMFKNAPQKNKDFIIAERKRW